MDSFQRKALQNRRDALLARLHQLPNLMRGTVYVRQRKCGRKTCECAQGGAKHPGLQLCVSFHGKTRTRFVRQDERAEITAMTEAYQELWQIVEGLTEVNLALLRREPAGSRPRRGA